MIWPDEGAKAGAAFLDEVLPGWWWDVSPGAIYEPNGGVLVKLYGGSFNAGADALELDGPKLRELGFLPDYVSPQFDEGLEDAWKREIVTRREQEKAAEAHQHELL